MIKAENSVFRVKLNFRPRSAPIRWLCKHNSVNRKNWLSDETEFSQGGAGPIHLAGFGLLHDRLLVAYMVALG